MIALIQRVSSARVEVAGKSLGEIGPGLLAFIGVEKGDNKPQADRLLQRLLGYRVFADIVKGLGFQELVIVDISDQGF